MERLPQKILLFNGGRGDKKLLSQFMYIVLIPDTTNNKLKLNFIQGPHFKINFLCGPHCKEKKTPRARI